MDFNEESVKKRIRSILDELQSEADPYLLNRYRSVFRKEVSFFRRSYAAAYLLLLAEEGRLGRGDFSRQTPKRDFQKPKSETGDEAPRQLPEEESVRLFISIGRNRKVFPREILGLIFAKTASGGEASAVSRDDIGIIRILDNYSFVQVRTAAAQPIIDALNGQSFRGRILTVNYARNRDSQEEAGPGKEADSDTDD